MLLDNIGKRFSRFANAVRTLCTVEKLLEGQDRVLGVNGLWNFSRRAKEGVDVEP